MASKELVDPIKSTIFEYGDENYNAIYAQFAISHIAGPDIPQWPGADNQCNRSQENTSMQYPVNLIYEGLRKFLFKTQSKITILGPFFKISMKFLLFLQKILKISLIFREKFAEKL